MLNSNGNGDRGEEYATIGREELVDSKHGCAQEELLQEKTKQKRYQLYI